MPLVKPVPQLVDSADNGDCFRACVASILEVDPLELPNISDPEYKDRYWVGVMNEALAKHGLAIHYTLGGAAFHEIPIFIWSVPSPRYEGKMHAVVVRHLEEHDESAVLGWWKVAWDPSPWRDTDVDHRRECYAKPIAAYFFVASDPAAWVHR